VRGSHVEGRKTVSIGIVSKQVQVSPHRGQPSALSARDIFNNHNRRSEDGNKASELEPESRSLSFFKACTFPRGGDVLAGETPAEDVDAGKACGDVSHVAEARDRRPVLRKHGTAEGVLFNLKPHGAETGSFQAKLKAPDTTEERADRERFILQKSP